MADSKRKPDDGKAVIFVKSFRHWRSGKIIRAKDYGKDAFAIPMK
jgi:hypothetical protein